jgi:hypothetical protein
VQPFQAIVTTGIAVIIAVGGSAAVVTFVTAYGSTIFSTYISNFYPGINIPKINDKVN